MDSKDDYFDDEELEGGEGDELDEEEEGVADLEEPDDDLQEVDIDDDLDDLQEVDIDDNLQEVEVDDDELDDNNQEEEQEEEEEEEEEEDKDENKDEDEDIFALETAIKINSKKNDMDSDDESDDDDDENYLQKFNSEINKNYIAEIHPECFSHNYDEIVALTKIVRDSNNNVIDPNHRTIPFLTKYEKTRIIGQRAKQINSGAKPFVKLPESVIDGYLIAEVELQQKRIPFIIRRPLQNGCSEYWNVKDLEVVGF